MKIQTNPQTQGSVLLISLLTASVIGVALGSYLTLTSNQHQSVYRSMTWNEGIPVAEAGVEDALSQIYKHGVTNFSANNWTWGTDGRYHKQRFVGTGGAYYDVGILPANPPVIVSTSYVPAPLTPSSALGMIFGTASFGGTSTPYVKRRIQVNTRTSSGMGAAIVSKGPISLSGNGVTIDSFDSSDTNSCPTGQWVAGVTIIKDNADVLTNAKDGLTSNGKPLYALNIGDADIKGHVSTGAGGTAYTTAGASVGDVAWVNAGTSGIEPGWSADDANVDVTDVQLPSAPAGWLTPVNTTVGKVKYTYYLPESANYKLSTLTGKVLVTGDATLWVTDDVNIGTGDFIEIAPGASLKLYVSAPSAVIGGQGIINKDNYARSFQYYGLPTNTSFDFKGNSAYTGTVYAPEADVKLGGGGTTEYDFVGSLVVKALTMNGHFHIHYDETLDRMSGSVTEYTIASWNEVDSN